MKSSPPSLPRKRRSGRLPTIKSSSTERVQTASATPNGTANALAQLWPLWILLGAVLGGGLRFLPPAPSLLPVMVGLGVAVIIVVALGAHLAREKDSPVVAQNDRGSPRSRERKKSSGRLPIKKDIGARLSPLTKSKLKAIRNDPNAN
jgi:hypothetical protein